MVGARPERLRLENVRKAFRAANGKVEVLRGVSLELAAGEFGVIAGPSGSGKTTLLMVAGLLQPADGGRVRFNGQDVSELDEAATAAVRKRGVGMVFQKFCLLPHRSALDNVEFRFRYLGEDPRAARELALAALERVGLAHKARQPARLLSVGEMQRVAIARALAVPPKLLLADEPTGNLDTATGERILDLLLTLHQRAATTIVMVTHSREVAARADRILMVDGGYLREVQ